MVMFAGDVNGVPASGLVRTTAGAAFADGFVMTISCGLFVAASREFRVTNTVEDDGL
jgi:hypothetical protein